MESKWKAASVVLALAAVLIGAPAAWAKPGDLPAEQPIECDDDPPTGKFEIELSLTLRGLTLKFGVHPKQEPAPAIDTFTPVFVDQCLSHLGDMLARPDRFIGLDALLSKLPNLRTQEAAPSATDAVQRLFEMAERHLRAREYTAARRLYQQVHQLAPTNRFGRLAIIRLGEVEERLRDFSEEQQQVPNPPDDPEQAFRDMHLRTVPLGLVDVSY